MTARTFRAAIDIGTDDAEIAEACGQFEGCPDIPGFKPSRHSIEVSRDGEGFLIKETGRKVREERALEILMRTIRWRLNRRILDEFPDAAIFNAASLTRGGLRILLAGGRRTGKSILALKLMHAGLTFEGDHQVFVRPRGVIAFQRPIHIAQRALHFLPAFKPHFKGRAPIPDSQQSRIYSYDPVSNGWEWRVDEGPANLIFLLNANHGGASSVRRTGSARLVQELLRSAKLLRTSAKHQLSDVIALASGAEGFDLSHGDPDEAVRIILRLLDEIPSCTTP